MCLNKFSRNKKTKILNDLLIDHIIVILLIFFFLIFYFRCQIVSAEDIRMYKKTWRPIDDLENFANSFKLQEITKNFIPLSSSLIDLHRSKCSAIENSIQTTSQLLEIGMIIDK